MGWRPSSTLDVVVCALGAGPVTISECHERIEKNLIWRSAWERASTPWWDWSDGVPDREKDPPAGLTPALSYQNVRTRVLRLEREGRAGRVGPAWRLLSKAEAADRAQEAIDQRQPTPVHRARIEENRPPACTVQTAVTRDEKKDWYWLTAVLVTPRGTVEATAYVYEKWPLEDVSEKWDKLLADLGL